MKIISKSAASASPSSITETHITEPAVIAAAAAAVAIADEDSDTELPAIKWQETVVTETVTAATVSESTPVSEEKEKEKRDLRFYITGYDHLNDDGSVNKEKAKAEFAAFLDEREDEIKRLPRIPSNTPRKAKTVNGSNKKSIIGTAWFGDNEAQIVEFLSKVNHTTKSGTPILNKDGSPKARYPRPMSDLAADISFFLDSIGVADSNADIGDTFGRVFKWVKANASKEDNNSIFSLYRGSVTPRALMIKTGVTDVTESSQDDDDSEENEISEED